MIATPPLTALSGAVPNATPSTGAPGAAAGSFAETLQSLVTEAESSASDANAAVAGMVDKSVDVHDAMIALQRAEMSLQLTIQIRNKLMQAYQDIMRMPV